MNKEILEFLKRSRIGFILLLVLLLSKSSFAQEQVTVEGVVRDTVGGLPGASVKVSGTNKGIQTDVAGRFKITAPRNATLIFSLIGLKSKEIKLSDKKVSEKGVIQLDVLLSSDNNVLEEVAITGFGSKQKKTSLVSSITTVNVKDLKTPSSNLTNALAGKVAGIISVQTSGEPGLGTDNSNFYIRGLSTFGTGKRDPLILIDGVESSQIDMARLQPDDISDFSVLKDAAASSVYGARGANGVVLINTKMGKDGEAQFSFRAENKISTNTKNFRFADNITYMNLANEAALTRSPNAIEPYSQNKILGTQAGADPYLFPSNNWLTQIIKPNTVNQSYNLNISGGSGRARYYIAGTYNRDNGILKVDPINDFNNNVRLNNYSVRSNVDFNVTKSTVFIIRMYGQFDDYQGPIGTNGRSGGATAFANALNANPVMFPARYPQSKLPYIDHPLFGSGRARNSDGSLGATLYVNPYAELVKGYQVYKTSNLQPQLEIKQDLNSVIPGLTARSMAYLRRISYWSVNRNYNPFFYEADINPSDLSYDLSVLNSGGQNSVGTTGTEYLNYAPSGSSADSRFWLEGSLNYDRIFAKKHSVGGMLVSYMSNYESPNAPSLIQSLPARNLGISGRFTYGFDDRYLAEFNFGYNGSERFDETRRFGFFPSAGLGYRISSEKFFEPLKAVISNLKFRATYGIVGNDAIGDIGQRFFYMSDVNLNNGSFGSTFGRNDGAPTYYQPGISIARYTNSNITWEKARQLNVGMDLGIGKGFELIVDAFRQHRDQILQPVSAIDNTAGLMATPYSNYGATRTKGVDLSGSYRRDFSKNFWINARGTFTYATSEVEKVDELPYGSDLSYLSRKGYGINQPWGYIAERLFVDEAEVANSPIQFGDTGLRAGDIKYRDINHDGVINSDDQVAIGNPYQPEITYGFGSTFGFKNFDFNFYFQGSARFSFFIDPVAMQPFIQSGGYQTGLLSVIADNHWSESNRDMYAFWPRLSSWRVSSNNVPSTWWLRNGSFLRLKNVDFGYTVKNVKKIGIKSTRLYFSAINLFAITKFKMWDVEMGGNGLGYPIQSVYSMGLQVNL